MGLKAERGRLIATAAAKAGHGGHRVRPRDVRGCRVAKYTLITAYGLSACNHASFRGRLEPTLIGRRQGHRRVKDDGGARSQGPRLRLLLDERIGLVGERLELADREDAHHDQCDSQSW
jgi:hypothetical protein